MRYRTIFSALLPLCFASLSFAQVTWDTAGNGNWEDGANWSTGTVPTSTDDVIINQGGGFLITMGASVPSINTLNSAEDLLLLQNINLVMETGGTVSGSLVLGINSDLTVNGGSFIANGPLTLDGGNVYANGGSTMNLTALSSYLTDTGTNASREIHANNASAIDLSALTDLTGGTFIRTLEIQANSGSSVDVSALTNYLGGSTRFRADGAGSTINVSSLAVFNQSGGPTARLRAIDGGSINAAALTTLQSDTANGNQFTVDGAGSSITASLLTDVINTRLQLTNGGTHDFSGVTNFFASDAFADGGVTLDLTGVTSYDTNGGGNNVRAISSSGAGTVVDLSNVTTMVGGTFIRRLNVDAASGGTVDFSGLADITTGSARFRADGVNSLIDLSALQTFNHDDGQAASLEATNGGEVRLDTNAASNLNFHAVNITLDAAGTIDTSRLTNFTQGIFTTNGVNRTLGLVDGTSSSFIANGGAVIDLSSLSGSLDQMTPTTSSTMDIRADGAGSRIEMANVTSMSTAMGVINSRINLEALAGGELDASGVTTLFAPSGIVNSFRPIEVLSDGAGSSVDLSSLSTFNDVSSKSQSSIKASNGGVIDLGSNLVLTNVDLIVDAGGIINGGSFELISMEVGSSGADDDFSVLSGDGGTVVADIINTSGIIAPGASPGTLTIDGNFTQLSEGLFDLEIDSLTLFDQLIVTGNGVLGGQLAVAIDDAFDLAADQDFIVLAVGGTRSGQFDSLAQGSIVTSDNGFNLRIDYFGGDGNDVRLTTGAIAVPEPGVIALAGICLVGLATRRRRS